MKTKILQLSFIISILSLIYLPGTNARNSDISLILYETAVRRDVNTALHFLDNKNAVTRFRDVQINEMIKSYSDISENDIIVLNLFSDAVYTAKVQKVEEIMEGNVTITANLLSFDYAFMVIATTEGRTLTNIFIPEIDINYQIISDPITLQHYLLEINPKLLPELVENPSLIPGELSQEELEEQEVLKKEIDYTMAGPNDPATVDVMIVYTPAARNWGNSNGGIFNIIATSIALGNTVLSNSNTLLTLRLVHNVEVQYTEVDGSTDLNRLTSTNDGYMDNVHTLRNTYGADLVQLFTTMGGGIGWLLNDTGGTPTYAFSCVGVGAVNAYSAIHEMGHNMGCHHHKQQNYQAGPGLYSYSAGWRWKGSNNQWYSSIMSYTAASYFPGNPVSSTRVAYFSNPSISFMGAATGHTTNGDNARTIRNTKHVVAAYRSTATINCIACPGYNFTATPGNSWVTHSSSIVASGCKIYRVSVQQGRTYTFKTGCGNGATANFDTRLYVFNDNCTQVAFNDDGCESLRSQVSWMATYTGYAYVRVNGYGSASGSYTMAYQRTDELIWTGNTSTNWNIASNWNGNVVPDITFDVIIPTGATRQPYINTADASCRNLTINSGATLTIGGYTLVVNNNMNITGTIAMNNLSGKIYNNGDVLWKSGSTANFTANTVFWVYGNWEFQAGSNANLANGVVAFTGTTQKFIRSYSQTSSFNNVSSYKDPGAEIGISAASNQVLKINGSIYVHPNATFNIYSSYDVILKGNLNNNGSFKCNFGRVVLNGANQSLRMNTGDYFNNLTFNQSGNVTIDNTLSNILEVKKDVVIKSGVFNMQNRIMRVGGDWTNEKGLSAFNAGTGRVIFNGASLQYVNSSENFNILEANMGSALRINNVAHTVTCNQYDWTSGGIDVLKGTFTALDLADNGLFGNYYVNPGGTINLHQDAAGWTDLNGQLNFNGGGNINIYGGSSSSYWPWAGNAEINMNGGVLDFKDQGIYIYNSPSYSFTHNITGGTIRTSGGLTCSRTGFTPAGGTFEFYGSTNASLNMVSGSKLRNVIIDKSSRANGLNLTGEPVYDQRSGKLISDGTRANNISLISNIDILGNLTIATGSLTLNGWELNIKQNCSVSGTLNMINPSDVLTVGQSYFNVLEFNSGSTANITAGTINIYGWIIPRSGSSFNASPGNTVVVKGGSGGGLSNHESSASYGNVILQKNSGEWSCIDLSATSPIIVNGSFTISPDNEFYMQNHNLTVNGAFTDASTSKIYMKDYSKKALAGSYSTGEQSTNTATRGGLLTINSDYTIQGLLDIADGNAVLTQGFGINSTGVLKINGGSFINNRADISNWTEIKGSLQLVDGLFELTNNHPYFNSGSSSVISGGTIRTGGAFRAVDPNVFKHTGGVVEITGNNNNGAIYCYNGNYFHNLVINRSSLYSAFMNGEPVTINNDFTVNKGQLNTSSSLVTVSGNVAINSGGHLSVDAGGGLALAASKSVNVNNGGLIEFNGTSGMQSKITRKSSGYYALNVENGGKIAAVHTIFEYMNTNGVNLKSGAIVDPSNAFTSCIFRNGQSGGRLLTINNSQTFALNNAMFPNNSWGSNFNVYKSVNSGVVTFGGHSGGFSGGSYEYDPNNRIHWGGEVAGNVTLQGVDVVNGQDICFDASNTLTVAGGGSTFIVQNGGNVNLIAGHNIRMLEGTSVRSGAYLHAFISNDYCTLPPVMLAVDEESDTYDEIVSEKSAEVFETQTDDFLRVYPNPTNGRVMLEFSEPTSNTIIEVYGLIGERILAKEISGYSLYELDLTSQPQGVYLVKFSNGNSVVLKKIIKK